MHPLGAVGHRLKPLLGWVPGGLLVAKAWGSVRPGFSFDPSSIVGVPLSMRWDISGFVHLSKLFGATQGLLVSQGRNVNRWHKLGNKVVRM